MDGIIFVILALFGIVNAIIKAARKQQAGSKGRGPEQPWQRMLGDIGKSFQETASGKPSLPMSPQKPSAPKVYHEGSGNEGQGGPGSIAARQTPVSSREAAIGEGASSPVAWRGSLAGTSEVFASSTAMSSPPLADTQQPAHAPFQLAFTRDSLVQAVVMQEILTRPADRRRRWSAR